ncbi:ABC transporter ATP-binding protein [Paraburkholderia sp. RP-4-7]|jgi:iron(III) transport system ATP-binding protein|uniref:ABC transporter ATP-binding protein n=1 Tax=Paraburkholderia polaris TaxID=2728848 RepID=A0A848ILU3_9BURK|nr:ABC transporter ATP-binding protein [Paraburkholderia polaris]NMM00785.1 ABC transporter ATP-binding protein [Paraburkholderia polaris]
MKDVKRRGSLAFERVTKRYGKSVAVDDISFSIEPKTLVTLLGPSGCGKTTTLRMIAGLERVDEGSILIGGRDVTELSAAERDVSMVFQSYALFPHMNVAENVAYGLTVARQPKKQARERALEALALVGLADLADRSPSELSGGQQQRVAVARALVLEPEILLLDEPLSNLDAKMRTRVRDEIRDLQLKLGLTAVYVTHDQEEALAISDQIVVMNRKKIAQQGSPREIFEAPADEFVADFIGNANLVDGEIRVANGKTASCLISGAAVELPYSGTRTGAVRIALRPEAIALQVASSDTALIGEVSRATYLGREMQYTIQSELGELFVVCHRLDQIFLRGAQVGLQLKAHGAAIIGAHA